MSLTSLGNGVYRDTRTGNFYERPRINGRRTFRKLDARTLKTARLLALARATDHARSQAGAGRSPYAPPRKTVGELCAEYQKLDCPDRHDHPRLGKSLYQENRRIAQLLPFWQHVPAESIKATDCHRYATRRKASVTKRGTGGRAVDLELTTLNNVIQWAVAHGLLDANPILKRPKFRERTIRHCRDVMPQTSEELHDLAAALFENRRSEPLGWQLLLEAMTGCRTSEILRLRWDAAPRQAGYIEGDHLWLARSKGGTNPFTLIHPALRELLDQLKLWRDWRRPHSPWFVPGFREDGKEPASPCALTHALIPVSKAICGERRTSHGLRAYYVTVRRSQGIADGQIAAEIGDATGAAIIASTYGAVPPNWQGGKELGWLPDDAPAWSVLSEKQTDGILMVVEPEPKILKLHVSA